MIMSFVGVCENFSLEVGGLRKFFEFSTISIHPPPADNKCQVPKKTIYISESIIDQSIKFCHDAICC